MCGIVGILSLGPPEERRAGLDRMMACVAHRGPDDAGVLHRETVSLGHRRLAIIDLSPGGHQPMVDGDNAIVFNGEIYNHKEIRKDLEAEGVEFASGSDTEVLLKGYRAWGEEIVPKLRGMFAFAIWDAARERLFCARDPFGKKPFYYHWSGDGFRFGSEIEAVVRALPSRPEPDERALPHYLVKGYFAPGRSAYAAVRTLQAGHCLEASVKRGEMREWAFWSRRFHLGDAPAADREAVKRDCAERLAVAVSRRFESDVPVGVLLSGGVDSSLVTLLAAEERGAGLTTFSATFKGTRFDEGEHAARVAEQARSRHVEVDVKVDDLPATLAKLVETYGEPFGDASAIPTYYLFQAIRPHAKVALTGDGGDEVFAGYKDAALFRLRDRLSPVLGVADPLGAALPAGLIASDRRRVRDLGYGLLALRRDGGEAFAALHRESIGAPLRRRLMRPEAWARTGGDAVEEGIREAFRAAGRGDLERYLNLNLERLTQGYLVKVDRASMAHAVEARSPLLDADLFAWASGLPAEAILKDGEPKSLLKDLLAERMGDDFARRRKMGFTPPLEEWLRDPATLDWVERRLTAKDSLLADYFDPEELRKLVRAHARGGNHAGHLWKLLFLDAWHARFHRGAPAPEASP